MTETQTPTPDVTPEPQTAAGGPSPVLVIFLFIPLLGIFVALLMIALDGSTTANPDTPDAPRTQTLVNRPAPYFELSTLDGEPVTLADYAGRTLFLNFWQTTCPPCVRELPAFAEFAADQGAEGAAVLAVNFDETTQQVRDFFDANGITGVPVAMDPTSGVRRTYGVLQIPVTYVIAPDGTVRFMQLGEMSLDEMEEYADLVLTTDPAS